MEKLRSEIRAAFEKEQAANPPISGLRGNVVERVTATPRRETRFQWLAVAAALVLGILVVAGLMSTRFAHRASVPVSPKATTVPDYGLPPEGVPLLYTMETTATCFQLQQACPRFSWRIAYDWQGHPRGAVKFDAGSWAVASPDGQFFTMNAGVGRITILDRLGKPIPGLGTVRPGQWADDNRHLCGGSLDEKTSKRTLSTWLPGEAPKAVAVFTEDPNFGPGQSIFLAACSFRNDQAIIFAERYGSPLIWVVRLSDGKTVSQVLSATPSAASADGAYIAEYPTGVIRQVADMKVVSTLAEGDRVYAFSGDGSLVLVENANSPGAIRIIDWRTKRTIKVWRYSPQAQFFNGLVTEPSGRSFALVFMNRGGSVSYDVLIVRGDGTTIAIPGHDLPSGHWIA
ncbi:MAG: hypothetical protein PVSMB9_09880 [Candidatus Dormibacteria bacterium]